MVAIALLATWLAAQPSPSATPAAGETSAEVVPEPKPSEATSAVPAPAALAPAAPESKAAGAAPATPESEPAPGASQPSTEELESRIEALEALEAERTPQPAARSTAAAFIQNRFNPDISLIADFALVRTSLADATAETLMVPGFVDESEREGKLRGFNFNYLEFALSAAVDPYFDFVGIVTLTPDGFDIEETYVDTRQLPFGFQLRIGKFFSAFGRLNAMHQHVWDFYDEPLVYEAFVGLEGFKNPGIRLSWTAPVDFLLQLNLEVFQGYSDESPLFSESSYELTAQDGTILSSGPPFVPSMAVGSLKTSFDVGDHVFLLGASMTYGHALHTHIQDLPTDSAFSAPGTILYGGELTYKYLISSYRSFTWQSEYLGLVSSGDLALASDGLVHAADKKQGGLYSQVVWRFDEPGRWRVGARFDLLTQNSLTVDGLAQPLDNMLQRYSAMLEYSPTEFSRFRLQYAYDRSRFLDGARKAVHEILLEMNIAVGPHGAHSF
jgi:hypothetical protein